MARTIHEIEIARQRMGACDIIGKLFVEEPLGSTHDPIVAAEAAAIAREIEAALVAIIAAHAPAESSLGSTAGNGLESFLKR